MRIQRLRLKSILSCQNTQQLLKLPLNASEKARAIYVAGQHRKKARTLKHVSKEIVEKSRETLSAVAQIIAAAGVLLDKFLSSLFSFVDSTKFTSWKAEEAEIFVCNRIAQGTVYPVGVSFNNKDVASPVDEAVPKGSGLLYGDAWFDDNKAIGLLFQKGYIPIICPNKNRWRGYYRKKARKLYRMPEHRLGYRQRGRGESPSGSLTNAYGDRLKVKSKTAMKVRIASRILLDTLETG